MCVGTVYVISCLHGSQFTEPILSRGGLIGSVLGGFNGRHSVGFSTCLISSLVANAIKGVRVYGLYKSNERLLGLITWWPTDPESIGISSSFLISAFKCTRNLEMAYLHLEQPDPRLA